MKCILLLTIFLICSCSSMSKKGLLSKKEYKDEKIVLDRSDVKEFEISDCAAGVFIIPINPLINFDEAIENKCGKDWEIYDLEQKESKFTIPILYGQYCRAVRGSCKKQ